jgi:hypothetical protein
MKSVIKKILQETLLKEALMRIDSDVNLIYDNFFKSDIDTIASTGIITPDMFKSETTTTDILRSELCVQAHKINPCTIRINTPENGVHNAYKPSENLISITINKNAVNVSLTEFNGDVHATSKGLEQPANRFLAEFSEHKLKGTIHHELVHCLDDSLHNFHLSKELNIPGRKLYIRGVPQMSSFPEVQALIHNIHQAKNKYQDIWDEISYEELLDYVPQLDIIKRKLYNVEYEDFLKRLKKRMYREGLLGKKMYNY